MSASPVTIILAEDDDGQAMLVERNLERAGFSMADEFPNLKAWWQRMKARPSFHASWPED